MDVPLVLAQSVEALEELSALIAVDGVGVRVVSSHHVVFQRGVGVEISATLSTDEFLYVDPLHDLAVQRTLLLLEVVGAEVDCPAPGVFPDHFLAERTLVLLQFGVVVVQVFLQGLPGGKPLGTMITEKLLLLVSFLGFT